MRNMFFSLKFKESWYNVMLMARRECGTSESGAQSSKNPGHPRREPQNSGQHSGGCECITSRKTRFGKATDDN